MMSMHFLTRYDDLFYRRFQKENEQYAIWILGDVRALAIKEKGSYVFFDLITHDEY